MAKIPIKRQLFIKELARLTAWGIKTKLHGKELSYNNIVDMEAAWNMVWEFTDPAACIIKHRIYAVPQRQQHCMMRMSMPMKPILYPLWWHRCVKSRS